MLYERALRPLLFRMAGGDAEQAHERVLRLLARASRHGAALRALRLASALAVPGRLAGPCEVFGLRFPTPVGLAAGFDKNGVAVPALLALGFGFVEVGTVTHLPQPGNPRPRLFRLPSHDALINRMGFNNDGAEAVAARLAALPPLGAPLGISLGKSRAAPLEAAEEDYLATLDALYTVGDYFAVNVSSPNTPGLRALQEEQRLDALLDALTARLRHRAAAEGRARPKPLLVKLAPDLDDADLEGIVAVCARRGASGLIAVNTTLARDGVAEGTPYREEAGGLSGRPLRARAVAVVRRLAALAGPQMPIVGCGGVSTVEDAERLLEAGASLLQVYTGFIYAGPMIARRLARGLRHPLR